jgi:hypothetical protein
MGWGLGYTKTAARGWVGYRPVLVIADVSKQKECCGAHYLYERQGEDLLPASRHDQDGQAHIPLLYAE